ncbi:lipid-binding protein [Fulvitalea axinellae]|uniref:Lipid-binding protein n=1 Tax=Fulvitalea axinellae TaxID=1182444 RepID=A0AAU9D253_9BACT|nr:lipid-binding protein [Fulvitalea axinellae]
MKQIALTLIIIISACAVTLAQTFAKIDTTASVVVWKGSKVGGEHHGNLNLKSGKLIIEDQKITGGDFTVDMTTITNSDLTSKKWNKKLVNHLKSGDFFDTKNHPDAYFKINDISTAPSGNAGEYTISGDMTVKGITKPISFPAKVTIKDKLLTAKADVIIDRTAFDIQYKSGSFFDNLGDKLIHDNFELKINLTANLE